MNNKERVDVDPDSLGTNETNPERVLGIAEQARKVLSTLAPREEVLKRMRFGIGESPDYTLEEVGQRFAEARERIHQIEKEALRKTTPSPKSKA